MEEEEQSKRNISEKWINNNVYEALEEIEQCYERMITGCSDLVEFIREMGFGLNVLPQIQLQNMKIMITKLDILIENTHELVREEDYNYAKKKNDICNFHFNNGRIKDGKVELICRIVVNKTSTRNPKPKMIQLNPLFNDLISDLSGLRSKMIKFLAPILFIKSRPMEEKEE